MMKIQAYDSKASKALSRPLETCNIMKMKYQILILQKPTKNTGPIPCFEVQHQGRRENSRGPGQNYILGPYDVIIFKQQD